MTPLDLWYVWAGSFLILLCVFWACSVVRAVLAKVRSDLQRFDGEQRRRELNDVMGRRAG